LAFFLHHELTPEKNGTTVGFVVPDQFFVEGDANVRPPLYGIA